MKIEDYPLATSLSSTDLLLLETSDGTKKVDISTLSSMLKAGVDYKPGDLYFSYDPTSPAEKFGGSWVQLTDVYLRAADNTATGGSDTVTLTVAQMPSHTHGMPNSYTAGSSGSDYVPVFEKRSQYVLKTYGSGGDEPHSIMPSYQNIYVWRCIED